MAKITRKAVGLERSVEQILKSILTDLESIKSVVNTNQIVATEVKGLANAIREWTQAYPLAAADLAIDTNFDVQNNTAIEYQIAGEIYDLSVNTTADTGTDKHADAGKWAVALITVDTGGNLTATWADNGEAGYDSEADAVEMMPSVPADECPIGYVTIQASAGNTWTAGTDALQGGAGGNAAQTTNYYNNVDAANTIVSAATAILDTVGDLSTE